MPIKKGSEPGKFQAGDQLIGEFGTVPPRIRDKYLELFGARLSHNTVNGTKSAASRKPGPMSKWVIFDRFRLAARCRLSARKRHPERRRELGASGELADTAADAVAKRPGERLRGFGRIAHQHAAERAQNAGRAVACSAQYQLPVSG